MLKLGIKLKVSILYNLDFQEYQLLSYNFRYDKLNKQTDDLFGLPYNDKVFSQIFVVNDVNVNIIKGRFIYHINNDTK